MRSDTKSVALVCDAFPPMRTSGAVQMRDLAAEFVAAGVETTVIVPDASIDGPWVIHDYHGARILRLKTPKTKEVSRLRRAFAETALPIFMWWRLKRSPVSTSEWQGLVWYSPTIFFGAFIGFLKRQSGCRAYLILRDIFPEWAVDMGIMRRGLAYRYFKFFEKLQYRRADTIGVQTKANLSYFEDYDRSKSTAVEVLENWLRPPQREQKPLGVDLAHLSGRTIFVYAGNMGVAQNLDVVLDLAASCREDAELGFLFVGRGTETERLKAVASKSAPENTLFLPELEPDQIPLLYQHCSVGIVCLDVRHSTHNIPGKFLSYMYSGLPALAVLNSGNDLIDIIESNGVGEVCTDPNQQALQACKAKLIARLKADPEMSSRCIRLAEARFSPRAVTKQILSSF